MTGKLFIAQRLTKTYGLDHATSGKLLFEQRELTALPDRQLTAYRRQYVGFVFQFYNLVPSLTAYENVTLVTEISDDPMNPKEALELVGIQARMDHFPSQLSGASNSVLPSLARLPNGRKYSL
jgi:putative ABC transport system ATP-binding protein